MLLAKTFLHALLFLTSKIVNLLYSVKTDTIQNENGILVVGYPLVFIFITIGQNTFSCNFILGIRTLQIFNHRGTIRPIFETNIINIVEPFIYK